MEIYEIMNDLWKKEKGTVWRYLSQQNWGLPMCLSNSKFQTIKNKSFFLQLIINLWNLLSQDIAESTAECKKVICDL